MGVMGQVKERKEKNWKTEKETENEICIQDLMVVCICYAIDQYNARCTGERKEKKKMKIWERKREWTLYLRFDGCASGMPLINVMPDGTGEKKGKEDTEKLRWKERMNLYSIICQALILT